MRVGLGCEEGRVLVVAVVAGHQRHAGLLHQRLGGGSSSPWRGSPRRRADEDEAGRGAGLRRSRRSRRGSRSRDGSPAAPVCCAASRMRVDRRGSSRAPAAGPMQHGLVGQAHVARAGDRPRSRRRRCGCRGGARCVMTRQAISPRLAIRILSNIDPQALLGSGAQFGLRFSQEGARAPSLPFGGGAHARRCAARCRRSGPSSSGRPATARISALHSASACGPFASSASSDRADGLVELRLVRRRSRAPGRCGRPRRRRSARRSACSGAPGARRWRR